MIKDRAHGQLISCEPVCLQWYVALFMLLLRLPCATQMTQVWLSPVQVYIAAGQSYELETKLRKLEQTAKTRFGGTTDSELSELEDVVALTAAKVQSAESEVSGDTE